MNLTRIAELLRELADEVERSDQPVETVPSERKSRPRRRLRRYPQPDREPTDIDVARARRLLRERGGR